MKGRTPALNPNPSPPWGEAGTSLRRFHLVNVSLPKTGTKSIAGIFRRFRAFHEFQHESATTAIHMFHRGKLDRTGPKAFLMARDAAGQLEVDSASFNVWYAELFWRARFLVMVREPLAWLESVLSHIRRDVLQSAESNVPYPARFRRRAEIVLGQFEPERFMANETLAPVLPHLSRDLLKHWEQQHNRFIGVVPTDRRLILRTEELSSSLPRLAAFAGVDVSNLDREAAHLHRRPEGPPILDLVDKQELLQVIGREPFMAWSRLQMLIEAGEDMTSHDTAGNGTTSEASR